MFSALSNDKNELNCTADFKRASLENIFVFCGFLQKQNITVLSGCNPVFETCVYPIFHQDEISSNQYIPRCILELVPGEIIFTPSQHSISTSAASIKIPSKSLTKFKIEKLEALFIHILKNKDI